MKKINIMTVYFPCYSSSVKYSTNLSDCLSYIKDVVSKGLPTVVLGDMNFQLMHATCDTVCVTVFAFVAARR